MNRSFLFVLIICMMIPCLYANENPYTKMDENDFDGAISIFQKSFSNKNKSYESALMLARIYSWTEKFEQSLFWYDKAKKMNPKDVVPYVESARVYFWSRKKNEAVVAYLEALKIQDQKWIKEEMEAVMALNNGQLISSLAHYENSLKENEDNQEALMMLGDLYTQLGFYDESLPYLEKLLSKNPKHKTAKLRLHKSKLRRHAYKIETGLTHWYARSSEQLTQVNTTTPYLALTKQLSRELSLETKYGYIFSRYSEDDIKSNQVSAGINYRKQLFWAVGGRVSYEEVNKGFKNRNDYWLGGFFRPIENLKIELSTQKENLMSNYQAKKNNISDKNLNEKIEILLLRNYIKVFESIKWAEASDKNKHQTYNAGLEFSLASWKHIPYLIVSKDWQRYDHESTYYYAPSKYNFLTTVLGIRENESSQFKYDLSLRHIYDSHQETAWKSELSVFSDVAVQLSLKGKVSITNSKYYRDNAFDLSLDYYID